MKCIMVCAGEYIKERGIIEDSKAYEDRLFAFFPSEQENVQNDLYIAVDGGLKHFREEEAEPSLILGDFDSLAAEDLRYFRDFEKEHPDRVICLPVQKDETDTHKAAAIAFEMGCREFLLFGAMGGRLDHTIANINTLLWLYRRGARGWLIGDHCSVTVTGEGVWKTPSRFDGTVSLFSLGEKLEGVTIRNMKYEVYDAEVTNDYPVGTSNETVTGAGQGIIEIGSGEALLVLTERLHNKFG